MNFRTFSICAILLLLGNAPAHAGIVLTTQVNQVLSVNGGLATVNVKIFGNSDSGFSQQVGFYAFSVKIVAPVGAPVTSLAAVYNSDSASANVWGNASGLKTTATNPSVNLLTRTISFKAGGPKSDSVPVPHNIQVPTSAREIGSFSFTTTANGDFKFQSSSLSTQRSNNSDTTGSVGNLDGFAFIDLFDNNAEKQVLNNTPINTTFVVSGITAVPEPSSLLLIGAVVAGWGCRRIRKTSRTAKPLV